MKNISLILLAAIGMISCRNTGDKAETFVDTKQEVIDSMKVEMEKEKAEVARQKSIDSMKAVVAAQEKIKVASKPEVVTRTVTVVEKRKGWSGAAKGAVIGAGVGAISGAVIDKKKPAQGAVIGGLAGAGIGAGTGAILDDKKKKK